MSKPHALIIDDQKTNIEVLTMLLEEQGVVVVATQSTHNLDELLQNAPPLAVVFLDLEFPRNNDGFQILAFLKTTAQCANVPIVAYTVHNSEIDVARRAGFHSFLGKPLNLHRFPDQLQRILNGTPVWEI